MGQAAGGTLRHCRQEPARAGSGLAADPRIQVAGYVADPLPYLQAADAFVVPLSSGGGIRVKILDAWLWGLPIVSTPLGAEGIDLRDGDNILLAADPASFAEATLRLLTDPPLNHRLRTQGRALGSNWRTIGKKSTRVSTRNTRMPSGISRRVHREGAKDAKG